MRVLQYALIAVTLSLFLESANADVYVNGYIKKDGTYVQPHYRSDPNGSFNDNWSTQGNVNPYTGQEGYKKPDYYNQFQNSN